MIETYKSLMDADRNPLRHLAPIRRFQLMVYLSVMWTAIFCAAGGLWFLYGEIVIAHVLLATGVLITGQTFRQAGRDAPVVATYRDRPREDGTARYDDVWGA